MLLIITGTITPMVKDSELVVRDQKKRLQQYMESIEFYIRSNAFQKIIFGENSNFPQKELESLFRLAKEQNVLFEYLTFTGDVEQINLQGKGYGEGEIMKYVFDNSQLLKDETDFMKITGRLIVNNISDIIKKCKSGRTYLNIPNRTIRNWYDTRIYCMPVGQFQRLLLDEYKKVNDNKKEYLEVIYTDVIKKKKILVNNFRYYPRIIGISGSTGAQYVYTEWKCKIKDFLSLICFYRIR